MSNAYKLESCQSETFIENTLLTIAKKSVKADVMELPTILLHKIFEYSEVNLKQRLINKKFNDFVLKNIKNLHFKNEVDE